MDQLENLEEAQREYVACMQTPASAAHAAQNAIAGDRVMRPPNVQDAWQDGCVSSHLKTLYLLFPATAAETGSPTAGQFL